MVIRLTINDKWFHELRFVALAASKKISQRYAVEYVKVKPGVIVATDGRQLHVFYAKHNFKVGLYSVENLTKLRLVLVKSKDVKRKFPAWQDIIPSHESYFDLSHSDKLTEVILGSLARRNVGIQMKFIKPITEYADFKIIGGRCFFGLCRQPVYWCSGPNPSANGGLGAVIAPFDIDYEYTKTQTKKAGD